MQKSRCMRGEWDQAREHACAKKLQLGLQRGAGRAKKQAGAKKQVGAKEQAVPGRLFEGTGAGRPVQARKLRAEGRATA